MRKLLLAAGGVTALILGSAQAAEVPKNLRGYWCLDDSSEASFTFSRDEKDDCEEPPLRLDRNGFGTGRGFPLLCKATRVVKKFGAELVMSRAEGVERPVYSITWRCKHQGETWTERQKLFEGKYNLLNIEYVSSTRKAETSR